MLNKTLWGNTIEIWLIAVGISVGLLLAVKLIRDLLVRRFFKLDRSRADDINALIGDKSLKNFIRNQVAQLNRIGSDTVGSSVVTANQKDPKKTHIVFPFGKLKKGEWRFAPPKHGADPENSMIYSADEGMRKVASIKIDQATGELKVVFVVDTTTTFQPLIGPKDKRVLLTNMTLNVEKEPIKAALFTENYKEQPPWRDAATGKILAKSDFFEPLVINGLTPPGFGGRIYFPTAVGKGF
jgi:hypothetical protein